MSKLLVIRGIPGSGKTTLAKQFEGFFHVEADMYFMHNGEYQFVPADVPKAHDWCQKQAARALERGDSVVVSNTFSRKWEIEPYAEMARKLNVEFEVIQCNGRYSNVHNVPNHVIDRMLDRWESWP
jgi:predicted kinase